MSAVERSIGRRFIELVEPVAVLESVIVLLAVFLFWRTCGGFLYNAIHIPFELPQKPVVDTYSTTSSY
jgi:hypothetical protein